MLLGHKKFLITGLRKAKEGEKFVIPYTDVEVTLGEGELLASDIQGNENIVTVDYIKNNYVRLDIDYEEMACGYELMGEINLEEANAGVHTYKDGKYE